MIHPVIVGTAGHVDHGKSSLVRRLTGIDPDRWREEKERGLTIDLGFAPLELSDGRIIGMIDVPGHERFLKNMVAGATSIDLAVLVIACDDSVMPQTREHLDVLELLGVRRGIVALTKVDLVDEETQAFAVEEIKELLAGRSLEGAPIVPVSSTTGRGIPELEELLRQQAAALEPRRTDGVFRMPVQRTFTVPGFGTVLTGILIAGEIAIGDTVELVGKGLQSRVRGIHAYGSAVERACAGHSTALNLPGIPLAQAHRGDVVALPDSLVRVDRIELDVHVVSDVRPLEHGERVHLHLGTTEVTARAFLIDESALAPGAHGLVQVLSDEPVVCLPGDFALLRRLSPARSIAGGRVIGLRGRRLRRFKERTIEKLRAKEAALDEPENLLKLAVAEGGEVGVDRLECIGRLGWTASELEGYLAQVIEHGEVLEDRKSGRLFSGRSVEREEQRISERLAAHYRKHALATTCPIADLRRGTGAVLLGVALLRLEAAGEVALLPGGLVQDPSRTDTLSPAERQSLTELRSWLEESGHRPQTRDDIAERFGKDGAQWLERLIEEEGAVAVGPMFVWGGDAYRSAVAIVEELCGGAGSVLDIPSLRDRLGTSRKFLIPFLEHLDRVGVTARKGDRRILRRK